MRGGYSEMVITNPACNDELAPSEVKLFVGDYDGF